MTENEKKGIRTAIELLQEHFETETETAEELAGKGQSLERAYYAACAAEAQMGLTVLNDLLEGRATIFRWQPIETAPTDGTWVNLTDGKSVEPGYFGPTYFASHPDWIQYNHRSEHQPIRITPTQWMPLPPAPAGKEGGE